MRALLLLLALSACAPTTPLTLGEPTYVPYGYTMMCRDRPEAFGCPR